MAIPNLYQSFWETLSENDWNKHFWPFLIYTSLSGKNCWKKFGTTIFGHSKFIPVFLGKIVGKNSEWPFLAIPNLYQSSWEKLLENNLKWPFLAIPNLYQSFWETLSKKNWNIHFWPFLIYTSPFGKNCQKKIGTSIFHHSWFIPVLLGKILRKILEQPFLAIPNLYQSSWEKLLEKNSGWPLLAIPNLYQSFWETLSEKDWNKHFWPFLIYTSLSGENCWKKLGTTILAIPNLYPSFWEKLSEKDWNKHFSPFLIYTSSFGKNSQKKIGITILAIPNLYQSSWEKLLEKI